MASAKYLGRKLGLSLAFTAGMVGCGQGFRVTDGSVTQSSTGPSPTVPVPVAIPELSSWSDPFPAGIDDPNCMTKPEYNICLIYKDPVTANNNAFNPTLTPNTSSSVIEQKVMTYGLKVPTSGALRNAHYRIVDPVMAQADGNGDWKFPYANDTNHFVAQVQTFYWLNRQITYMQEQTGKFYAVNRNLSVRAYDAGTANNAYYNGTGIVIGYRPATNGTVNVGLDASVIAHEAGHANLDSAMLTAGSFGNCPSKNGCLGAIHEGVGDVHTFILFPDKGDRLGAYFVNSLNGLRSPASIKQMGVTAQDLFSVRQGEVHDMGEAYGSIWWEVWNKAKGAGKNKEIEVVFSNHLSGIMGSDNFTSALAVVKTMANQLYPARANQIIADFVNEYNRMGITVPQ